MHKEIFFLYKFWKSFVYAVKKEGYCESTFCAPRDLKFCMAVYTSKRNGISFAANSSQIFLHLEPPNMHRSHEKLGTDFKHLFLQTIGYYFPVIFFARPLDQHTHRDEIILIQCVQIWVDNIFLHIW